MGLGNPGTRYENSRHNIGFLVLQKILLPHFSLKVKKNSWDSLSAHAVRGGAQVHFLLPQTFMNLSGKAVRPYMERHSIEPQDTLVIYDDLDLATGKLRFRVSGSSAGHQGVESLMESLGTSNFHRLRLGIGRPTSGQSVEDYVLETFSREEKEALSGVLERAGEVVQGWLSGGPKGARDILSRIN